MAQAKIPDTPIGAVGSQPKPLADRDALLVYWINNIKPLQAAQKITATKNAEAVKAITEAFNYATADLKVDREQLEAWIKASGTAHKVIIRKRADDDWALGILGVPFQNDMFAEGAPQDTAQDQVLWRARGYTDGIAGNDLKYPDGMHSMFNADYEHGWNDGQALNIMGLAQGKTIREMAGQPQADPALDMSGGGEGEEELDPHEKAAADAEKLKASGFMETGGPDAGGEGDAQEAGSTETFVAAGAQEGAEAPEPFPHEAREAQDAQAQAEGEGEAVTETIRASGEPFTEATEEELSQQPDREAIRQARQAAISSVH